MSTTSDMANAAQALAASLLASCVNPADGVRLMASLASFVPNTVIPLSAQGTAMQTMQNATADLCRRAAVVAMARASINYQPSSYNDALTVRTQICDMLDDEILIAGDKGQDATFNALRALRVAVVQDLTARGADLASIKTFSFKACLPAPVLAMRLYADASRADELVTQANPVHPLFMPTSFQALAE